MNIIIGLLVYLFILGSGAVHANNQDEAEAEAEGMGFLHFGNMGGLMPELTLDDLPESNTRPAALLLKYCSQCHNVPGPGMRTEKQWSSLYWDMYWRMHLMNAQFKKFEVFQYNDGELVFQYLLRNALKSVKSDRVKTHLEGSREYQRTCMQCHDLPDPKGYQRKDWGSLVQKMKRHMRSMGKVLPSSEETTRIINYLKKASVE